MKPIEVLMLSRDDILALKLTPPQVVHAVEPALAEHAAGSYEMHPKIGVHPTGTDPANFSHAMPAYLKQLGACGLKWVAGFAKNYQRDLPNVSGIQVDNDSSTGIPLAIMECGYLTGLRTAACGFEGTMHLWFLASLIPGLREVRLRDIRPAAMQLLKEQAGQ